MALQGLQAIARAHDHGDVLQRHALQQMALEDGVADPARLLRGRAEQDRLRQLFRLRIAPGGTGRGRRAPRAVSRAGIR